MRALRTTSGYIGPGGVMHDDPVDYLLAVVRERYAQGMFAADELERRIAAALAGDYVIATDSPFMPPRMELREW